MRLPLPLRLSCSFTRGVGSLLELVELELNLFCGAALLINGDDALLKVHAGLDRANDLVAGSEDAVKQFELLSKQLVNANVGGVRLIEEVDADWSASEIHRLRQRRFNPS